ncbi:MAG: hypothetical protein IKM30_05615 [Oscillospiraceae bacterium]|nr:hypothetical protein [Oscillospiraceae bacterium]
MTPKNILRTISAGAAGFVPHLLITCSIMAITFCSINRVNDAMNFVTARISTGFQSAFWLLAFCTTAVCLVKGVLRWISIPPMLLSGALLLPALRAFVSDHPLVPGKAIYQHGMMANAILILIFAVVLISKQRKNARAAYQAALQAQQAAEMPEETEPIPAAAD